MDHRRLTYYPPAIPSASSFENQCGHFFDFARGKEKASSRILSANSDPRFALAVENHAGICLACNTRTTRDGEIRCLQISPGRAARAIRNGSGLQIVQQVRAFVDDNVTVGIVGLVGGPSNMRKVSREAVASYLNIFWLEPMIPEQGP